MRNRFGANLPVLGRPQRSCTVLLLAVWAILIAAPTNAKTLLERLETNERAIQTIVQTGHQSLVLSAALTTDEQYAASASLRIVKIWETFTGREVAKLYISESWINAVAFSPDGSILFTGDSEGRLTAINWRTKAVLYEVQAHPQSVTSIAVDAANDVVVTGSYDGGVKGWDFVTGTSLWAHELQGGAVSSVAVSPDGRYVVSGGGYRNSWRNSDEYPVGRVVVWDTHERHTVWAVEAHHDDILSVAVSPDGRYVATGGYTAHKADEARPSALILWELKSGELVRMIEDVTQSVWSIDFSTDSTFLIAAGELVHQIDIGTGELKRTTDPAMGTISKVILGAADDRILFSAREGAINLIWWSIPDEASIARLEPKIASIHQVDVSKTDPNLVLSSSSDSTVMVWDLSRGEPAPLTGDLSDTAKIARKAFFSNDGSIIVTVLRMEVTFWDAYTGRMIKAIRLPFWIRQIDFDPFDQLMAVVEPIYEDGGYRNRIHIYSIESGDQLQSFEGHSDTISDIDFAPDGSWLLTTSWDKTGRAWDVKTGRQITSYGPTWGQMATGAISPDGKYVVTGSNKGGESLTPVVVWDARTGDRLFAFRYSRWTRVQSLAFTPDGRTVIAGDTDGFVRAWRMDPTATSGHEIGRHDGGVRSVAISSDGMQAWTSSEDGTVALWNIDASERIVSMVSRGIEWAVYDHLGNFDKSNGFDGIHFVVSGESVGLDQYFDSRFAPGILMLKSRGEELPKSFARVAKLQVPPSVQIVTPACRSIGKPVCAVPSTLSAEPGTHWAVKVRAVPRYEAIAQIALYHNQKRVAGPQFVETDPITGVRTATFSVELLPSLNSFAAEAHTVGGTISNTDRVNFDIANDEVSEVDLFVLAIGIDDYANDRLNLNYAKNDAKRITEIIDDRAEGLYSSVDVKILTDSMATKERLHAEFDRIAAAADVNDVFIFFYAGHGRTLFSEEGRPVFFLVTHEVENPQSEDDLHEFAFAATKLVEMSAKIPANKQVFLFDACEAEGVVADFQSRGMPREKALHWLNRAAGVHIIAAARSRQLAVEIRDLGHGAFSYGAIEAIQTNSFLTVGGLAVEIEAKVREISEEYESPQEAAYFRTRFSQDFPLYAENRSKLLFWRN